jgi:hypothetical protein
VFTTHKNDDGGYSFTRAVDQPGVRLNGNTLTLSAFTKSEVGDKIILLEKARIQMLLGLGAKQLIEVILFT